MFNAMDEKRPSARMEFSGTTGAIHVYGGDFFAAERSEWDPETLREQPYDVEKTLRLFEEANRQ